MKCNELCTQLDGINETLYRLYGEEAEENKKRYFELIKKAEDLFGDGDYHLFSAPGRSEICGNHTDHQHGKVVAASVHIDTIAIAKKNEMMVVNLASAGFHIQPIDLNDLHVVENEKNHTEGLIRGIAARFVQLGYHIGGFDGVSSTKVLVGSGISSSASFEVLVAEIFNHLFNEGKVDAIEIAKIAQYAENVYFGKPCGLLDQMAISCGGFTIMDFQDPKEPIVKKVDFDFSKYGYHLILTNTKGNHSDLSYEYAAIPDECRQVAQALDVDYLREADEKKLLKNFKNIRLQIENDRALLRAMHVFEENKRVDALEEAIENKDMEAMLKIVKASGQSSSMYLQNIYCSSNPLSQSLSIGLCLSDFLLDGKGAFRVHGGGFEGTIQAFVPDELLDAYISMMQDVFGEDAIFRMKIRSVGGIQLI